ncbi:MAG TPA: phosphatidylserine decarboxylase [Verrucomicrobiales bacterium]|nr:phosphatidylserine decarboxylase [Pedosphaera sp.]MBL6842631.1 phosphatidylserine decarboxylase [Verrucomicrobiae bacterium]RZO73478.1 MAG: phosphatidylserine decarboxylase [Limisphaerales bacterium]HAO65418.1 phosphatidylserine decarboxylase [Verrucomicrobiales bacterium]HAQ99185.1 phosphatidylserine decarboxylase [Verrucomicrobiales bacterium]|tara:strand:- start:1317 stop:2222 length:906 start_codon:yes stop_codon:yes gene_type:complete
MNVTGPIHFYNRYTEHLETEAVYGGGFLKWAYGNPLGRVSVELLVKRAFFSYFYGWWMDRPSTVAKVKPFVESFGLDAQEFAKKMDEFTSFNDFFSRELKSEARPIADDRDAVVFPADGRHLGFQDLSKVKHVFVKGQSFDLDALLGNADLANRYRNGSAVLSRLCPTDYHRFHFSVQGKAGQTKRINGDLYSVNPMALRQNLNYLCENKRTLTSVRTDHCGEVLIMEIGATNVGSILQTFQSGASLQHKGQEKGYFRFGGSATMTFFEPGAVRLAEDLRTHSANGIELYARMGDLMGRVS